MDDPLTGDAASASRPAGRSRRGLAPRLTLTLVVLVLAVAWSPLAHGVAGAGTVATWIVRSIDHVDGRTHGQGYATVLQADGTTTRYFTGDDTVPSSMKAAGWNHNGDPDSAQGYIFEAYQNANGAATEKLFHVTAPDGTMTDHVHQTVAGEMMNNSFAAVSPDAQWMVSGEWEAITRLLIMPTPILNPGAPGPGEDLPVTGRILLDQTVVDIQGCTFQTSTRMFCTSDDPVAENGLPRKALLQVDLARPLDGGDVAGAVSLVFALPVPPSICPIESPGSWPTDIEIEGIDYDRWTGVLGVVILPPRWCALDSRVYNYTSAPIEPQPTTPGSSTTTSSTSSSTTVASTTSTTATTPMPARRTTPTTAGPAPTAATTVARGALPATGRDFGPMVATAVALLALGTLLVRRARTRGAPRPPGPRP